MPTVVAIHQPNFFPWLGYFDKIIKSNIFVFMDDVQFPMTSRGCWVNRVRMSVAGKPSWVTCPVKREKSKIAIKDLVINEDSSWRGKFLRTLEYNYKKAPYFDENWEFVKGMVTYPEDNISRYNIRNIERISNLLNIDTKKFVIQSNLQTKEKSTMLLIEIVKKINGDTYLCGGGADGYQEDNLFQEKGLKLVYQNFEHPLYLKSQAKKLASGLSILDYFFNIGVSGIKELLE